MSARLRANSGQVPHTRIEEESDLDKIYKRGKTLGKGGFGVVYKASHKQSGEQWAIKIIHKEKAGSSAIRNLEREVAIMKMVQHEHVVKLHEVYETSKQMYLVMELCEGGELQVDLRERGPYTENETRTIIKRLAMAVAYLHDHDIVHRDLKLANILLINSGEERSLDIKVSDFGLAYVVDRSNYSMMQTTCGTPLYMAPEVINGLGYTRQCDVWSIGVIMYMLLCGEDLFVAENEETLFELIKKGDITFNQSIWENISDSAKDLLRRILCVNTANRYTAKEILNNSWITGSEGYTGKTALELMRIMREEQSDGNVNSNAANGKEEEQIQRDHSKSKKGNTKNKTNKVIERLSPNLDLPARIFRTRSSPSGLNEMNPSSPVNQRLSQPNVLINNKKIRSHSGSAKPKISITSEKLQQNDRPARSNSFVQAVTSKHSESHHRLSTPTSTIPRCNSGPSHGKGSGKQSSSVPTLPPVSQSKRR